MLSRRDHAELLRPVYETMRSHEIEVVTNFHPTVHERRTTAENIGEAICWDDPDPDDFHHGFDYGRIQALNIDCRAELAGCIEALQKGRHREFWRLLLSAQRGDIDQDVPLDQFAALHIGGRSGAFGDFARGFRWGFIIQAPFATSH